MLLDVPEPVCQEMIAHCRASLPNEGCGILAGRGGQARVFYPVKNTEASPSGFFMDPAEQIRVMRTMREEGLRMLAICHSHPDGPAYPSEKDVRLAFYEDAVYLIVSFEEAEPAVAVYGIKSGAVVPAVLKRS